MSFHPDPQAGSRSIFFRKLKKACNLPLRFNNKNVSRASLQKHLVLTLYNMVKFDKHLRKVSNEISETIGLLRKLKDILRRPALVTLYNCFIRPHLDYGDIIYDQSYKLSFHQKTEPTQYNAALALAGEIGGRSKEKLY